MAKSEVRPDQGIEDGQEHVNRAARATDADTRQGAEENFEHGVEAAAPAESQTVEPETPISEPESAPSFEEGVESDAAEEDAGVNGVSSADPTGMPLPAAADDNSSSEADREKPQGFFRRRVQGQELKKLKTENEKLEGELEAARERYMRLAAEMENFRKRTDRDFYARIQAEVARMVAALLPLVDDLERCLSAKDEAQDYEALKNGVALIHQKFGKVLSSYGVKPMTAVGEAFDPNLHDALAMFAREDQPSGIVLEEHSKGYMIGDKVLRPAQVLVSQ